MPQGCICINIKADADVNYFFHDKNVKQSTAEQALRAQGCMREGFDEFC